MDVFRYCRPLKALGNLMIMLVLGVVGANYYSLVLQEGSYGSRAWSGSVGAALLLVLFHALLGMLLWCYFAAVLADNSVPLGYCPKEAFGEEGERLDEPALRRMADPRRARTRHGHVRFCRKCQAFKPPRTHHCSICGKCQLKMDHHCIWVVNCVGAANYKSFLLFLFYTEITCAYSLALLLPDVVDAFSSASVADRGDMAVPFLAAVLDMAFTLAVAGFLVMHLNLVRANTTTIESFEKLTPGRRWLYDVGVARNVEQVLGTKGWWRFVPLYSAQDKRVQGDVFAGLDFPTAMLSASDADGDNAALGGSSDADLEGGGSVRARVANAV